MLYQREIDDSVLIQFIILYTLAKVKKAIGYDTLLNLIMENCNVNYAEFQIALDNLLETKHIQTFFGEKKRPMFEILQKGIDANDFFQSNIPIYIREPIKESIKPILREENEKKRVRARIVPVTKGQFSAQCTLTDDDNIPLMDLSFYAGTRKEASKIAERFHSHPDEIYRRIMEILTEEETKGSQP